MHSESSAPGSLDKSYYAAERREMLQFIPTHARRFLEIGCGSGAFGGLLRRSIPGAHIVGLEVYPPAAKEARALLDEVVELPVETALDTFPPRCFDCIIGNDVLEHLVDPWAVLQKARGLLLPNGRVVASIPNVRHFPVFRSYFLDAEWKYEKWGVLDKTHLRFFTKSSIYRMFDETGYEVERLEGIFGGSLSRKARLLNWVMGGRLEDMKFQRFAIVAGASD